jgi:hypothetical protein
MIHLTNGLSRENRSACGSLERGETHDSCGDPGRTHYFTNAASRNESPFVRWIMVSLPSKLSQAALVLRTERILGQTTVRGETHDSCGDPGRTHYFTNAASRNVMEYKICRDTVFIFSDKFHKMAWKKRLRA